MSNLRMQMLLGALATLALATPRVAAAQIAPYCQPGQPPQFVFGFAALRQLIGGAMGDPIECEHANPANGDALQKTTTGLAFYRTSTNAPTFTDGLNHWALTTAGVVTWTGDSVEPPSTMRLATPAPARSAVVAPVATSHDSGPLTLSTPAFGPGGPISWRYTCYNVLEPSPPLSWSDVPAGTRSLAVVVDAPERPGGIFTHWLIFNLPSDLTRLPEDVPKMERLDNGAFQGRNDFGGIGFAAPCPPVLTVATYRFALYALNASLDLSPGASEADVLRAAAGHVLAQAQISGTYLRPAWPWG